MAEIPDISGSCNRWLSLVVLSKSSLSPHVKHKQLSEPPHAGISKSLISNGKQETLLVYSRCVWLMATHELLFNLCKYNGVCARERFTILFTVKHLVWRMISCTNSKCSSSCTHLADAISCNGVKREWESRCSVKPKIPRQWWEWQKEEE